MQGLLSNSNLFGKNDSNNNVSVGGFLAKSGTTVTVIEISAPYRTSSTTPINVVNFKVNATGMYHYSFNLVNFTSDGDNIAYARIYKNNISYSEQFSSTAYSNNTHLFEGDINVLIGDTIQFMAWSASSNIQAQIDRILFTRKAEIDII